MMLFDTHCHIADAAFDADREAAIDRFRAAGVLRALVVADPGEETPNQQAVFDLAARHAFLYLSLIHIYLKPLLVQVANALIHSRKHPEFAEREPQLSCNRDCAS